MKDTNQLPFEIHDVIFHRLDTEGRKESHDSIKQSISKSIKKDFQIRSPQIKKNIPLIKRDD